MPIPRISAGAPPPNAPARRAKSPRSSGASWNRRPDNFMKQHATITVIGRDRTGVIARVTGFLFEQHANIEALEEQVTRGQFSMTLQASWARKDFTIAAVRAGLDRLALALGMEIKLRAIEPGRRQRFAIFVTKEPQCLETRSE